MKNYLLFKAEDSWNLMEFKERKYKSLTIKEITSNIKRHDTVFSLQISDFIREFHKEYPTKCLPILIDIESFTKQFWQKSKPLETQKKWNFFKFLKKNGFLPKDFKIQGAIEEYLNYITYFIDFILKSKGEDEFDRFTNIEIPINNLIYKRQRKGIRIDETVYPDLIRRTEEELFDIKNQLQLNHQIFTPDTFSTQVNVLDAEGIEIKGSLLALFKSRKSSSEICRLFYEMIRTENDLRALLFLTSRKGGQQRTYPNFYGFGSISSRITLREPALQNLRKKSRKCIIPDENFEFIYVDYSQFEAGILASLGNDNNLQRLYNSDIYNDIILNVWSGNGTRDEAKMLFYKYIYGVKSYQQNEKKYFETFKNLTKFKEEIENEIEISGKVASSNGNHRILKIKDKSIALSHRIQSEASLIFKEALLEVQKEIQEAEFVLPMHDAALYQVNTTIFDKKKIEAKIVKIFTEVFAKKCPGINHLVKIKDFYTDKNEIF